MAFLAPLVEMGAAAAAPTIESLVGKEMASTVAPLAQKALGHIISSKSVHKKIGRLGNHLFGHKHHKTARSLMSKGSKIANIASSKQAQGLMKAGLSVGEATGVLSGSQAANIKSGYGKALSMHDQLSKFNKPEDPLVGKVSLQSIAKQMAPMAASAVVSALPADSTIGKMGRELRDVVGLEEEKLRDLKMAMSL